MFPTDRHHLVAAAGTDDTFYLSVPNAPAGVKYRLADLRVIPHADLTADGSNYGTLTIFGSDGSTALVTRATSSTGLTGGTPEDQSFSTGPLIDFDAGDVQKVTWVNTGTGVAIDATVEAVYEQVPAVS